jgi:hypothetical protein
MLPAIAYAHLKKSMFYIAFIMTQNRQVYNLKFEFDMAHNPPLATVDWETNWSLYVGDDACRIYEFLSHFIDLDEVGTPPDEAE